MSTPSGRCLNQFAVVGHRLQLCRHRFFQQEHRHESLADGGTAHQHAVIAQDHDGFVAKVANKALTLCEIERGTLVIVKLKLILEEHRRLSQRQQPIFEHGKRQTRLGSQGG